MREGGLSGKHTMVWWMACVAAGALLIGLPQPAIAQSRTSAMAISLPLK